MWQNLILRDGQMGIDTADGARNVIPIYEITTASIDWYLLLIGR